ncbi:hypothetical protein [Algoriphagus litoralis]|uniref:hypothetical protein n=1 Tax=Algoriphagus litoralis TaxID=2202829 RepID=UPI0013002BA9|nr:hypothetical protein [Algoriphagus litoralis]
MLNISFKKVLLSSALIFGTVGFSQANHSERNQPLEEGKFEIEITGMKELPSITLVDKELNVIAEFYGESTQVKEQFESTFEKTELLSKHNNRSIYLIVGK